MRMRWSLGSQALQHVQQIAVHAKARGHLLAPLVERQADADMAEAVFCMRVVCRLLGRHTEWAMPLCHVASLGVADTHVADDLS